MPVANVREGKVAIWGGIEVTVETAQDGEARLRFERQEQVRILRPPEKKPVDTLKRDD